MLSPADQRLIDRDQHLPSLLTLIDPERFIALANRLIDASGWSSARLTYLRYKPGQSCLAGYAVLGEHGEGYVHATTYTTELASKLDKTSLIPNKSRPTSPGVFVDMDRSISAYLFPNDRRLRALRRVTDTGWLPKLLQRLSVCDRTDPAQLERLVYKPQRRFVGKVSVSGAPAASLKIYTKEEFQSIHQRTRVLCNVDTIQVPRVIGVSPRHQTIAYEWLDGQPLIDLLRCDSMERVVPIVRSVGQSLAGMHACTLSFDPITALEESRLVEDRVAFACQILPEIAGKIERLYQDISDRLGSLPTISRPAHGDFYAKQVLVQAGRVGFIDFDEAVNADPARDLANFLAHLRAWQIRGHIPAGQLQALSKSLLGGYEEVADQDPDLAERVAVYEAAALIKLAPHCFRHRLSDWNRTMDRLLDEAGACLGATSSRQLTCTSRSSASTRAPKLDRVVGRVPCDPSMPMIADLCDPEVMQEVLCQLAIDRTGNDRSYCLTDFQLLKHKPGRRCLVEFRLRRQGSCGLDDEKVILGKVRAKGADRRTYHLMKQLREVGFDGRSGDGISVPRPLGLLPEWSVWFQDKVPGRSVIDLFGVQDIETLAGRAAESIHKLHSSTVQIDRSHQVSDEMAILSGRFQRLSDDSPDLVPRLASIMDGCRRVSSELHIDQRTLIHRDFFPDHLLIDGTKTALIDFDLACMGDPALDVGNYIAHLIEWGLRYPQEQASGMAFAEAFEQAYCRFCDQRIRMRIRGYTLLALARLMEISTRYPGREHTTQPLIGLCERSISSQFPHEASCVDLMSA